MSRKKRFAISIAAGVISVAFVVSSAFAFARDYEPTVQKDWLIGLLSTVLGAVILIGVNQQLKRINRLEDVTLMHDQKIVRLEEHAGFDVDK